VFTDNVWKAADRDEFLRAVTTLEGIANLRTPFRAGGRVVVVNSAELTDGATAAFLAVAETPAELGVEPKMRVVALAFARAASEWGRSRPGCGSVRVGALGPADGT